MASLLGVRAKFLALARIEWWYFRARTASQAGDLVRAEELYARCAALAEVIDDERLRAEALVDQASALSGLGRVKESLAVSAPLLPNGTVRGGADLTYHALTVWIMGALDLAVSAPAIERVLTMLENHVDAAGHPEWRCTQLNLRSRLLTEQDRLEEALALAKEAWVLWRRHRNATLYFETFFVSQVIYLAMCLSRPDEIRRLLADLELVPTQNGRTRQRLVLHGKFSIALTEGRFADAVRAREQLVAMSRNTSDRMLREHDLEELARTRMTAQQIEQARRDIVRLMAMRHGRLTAQAYYYRELLGDVHLAAARRALGLPSTDFDLGNTGAIGPPDGADPIDPVREARRARTAYRIARPFAEQLDTAFQSTRNRDRLRRRLRLLDELPL